MKKKKYIGQKLIFGEVQQIVFGVAKSCYFNGVKIILWGHKKSFNGVKQIFFCGVNSFLTCGKTFFGRL